MWEEEHISRLYFTAGSMIYYPGATDNELISLEFYLSKSSHHLKDEKSFLFYPIFISKFSINCYIQVIILKI